jgi:nitrous oxide reductase
MKEKIKQDKTKNQKVSRRKFLKTAAVAGAAAGSIGFPSVMRLSAAETVKIKMQTAWDAGTLGFVKF